MDRRVYEEASRVAQSVVHAYKPELFVDGKWGNASQAAYDRMTGAQRMAVDGSIRPMGVTTADLKQFRDKEKLTAAIDIGNSNAADVRSIVAAVAREAGIPESLLLGFIKIESNFNPRAANGSSRGLGQIQPGAWKAAMGVNPMLPKYDAIVNGDWAVWDPLTNARASAAYIKVIQRDVNRLTGLKELTPGQLYVAYQQGPGGFTELWRAANGLPAKTSYVTPTKMLKNVPQDKLGPTTSKPEFYRRWVAIGDKKAAA